MQKNAENYQQSFKSKISTIQDNRVGYTVIQVKARCGEKNRLLKIQTSP